MAIGVSELLRCLLMLNPCHLVSLARLYTTIGQVPLRSNIYHSKRLQDGQRGMDLRQ